MFIHRQCPDEADLCSETENYSVEESISPTSTTSPVALTAATNALTNTSTTTSTSQSKRLYSREECLHQSAGVGGDIGPRPRRPKRPSGRRKESTTSESRRNSIDSGSSEDPTSTSADLTRTSNKSSPMVITASLTIPMSGAFTLNLDDPDIPYIEDTSLQQMKQQQSSPNAPPRRQRQRSVSGSEGNSNTKIFLLQWNLLCF